MSEIEAEDGITEQTDKDQRGGGRGIREERRGRD